MGCSCCYFIIFLVLHVRQALEIELGITFSEKLETNCKISIM